MKESDKAKLRSKLGRAGALVADLSKTRYAFVARFANGGTAPVGFNAKPTSASWASMLAQMKKAKLLDTIIMMVVVDAQPAEKRSPYRAPETAGASRRVVVLYEYITPKWSALTSVPGIKEAWQSRAEAFKGMVLPWGP